MILGVIIMGLLYLGIIAGSAWIMPALLTDDDSPRQERESCGVCAHDVEHGYCIWCDRELGGNDA